MLDDHKCCMQVINSNVSIFYRRMFPSLRVSFTDLDPKANYQVFFDIAPVDNKRYRYAYHRSSWLVAGRADPPIPRRYVLVVVCSYSIRQQENFHLKLNFAISLIYIYIYQIF